MERFTVAPDALEAYGSALLQAEGLDARSARMVAAHLVGANQRGHDSHGVGMLPQYVSDLRRGGAHKRSSEPPAVLRAEGPLLVLDAEFKFGQVVLADAMADAAAVAREHGVCLVSVRRVHHVGRLGAYAEMCASHGLVSMFFGNINCHPPLVAPFCGSDPRTSTNPVALGVPRGGPAGHEVAPAEDPSSPT